MTTFSPGAGGRLALLDLGVCYPAGTVVWFGSDGYFSAFWSGHVKVWDIYIVAASSLAALAAAEAAVDVGGTGYLYHTTHQATTDSSLGDEWQFSTTNQNADPLLTTSRYLSIWVKPQFSAVPWYSNDASVLYLGGSGVGGASSVSCPVDAPIADFGVSDTSPAAGVTIAFTDLSLNAPTSWLWDFGDGATSTAQNPTHAYAGAGTYSVSLTATNAGGSDTITKGSYIGVMADSSYEPPPPAGVLLEIYAAAPGSARWGVAKWGEAVWSSAGWRDVTPYGVVVKYTWGSARPELGILSTPDPASWAIDYRDPDRILDPSNPDSPYFGDLIPFLPIRVSHRGTIGRVAYATAIGHRFEDEPLDGYMRATDNISRAANADVPPDTTLADTLYARAADAIAAAGLTLEVAPLVGTDPPVSAWVADREWSVWRWISDAAQETLHIPIVDRLGRIAFRPYAAPLNRARGIASPELVGLQAITDYAGMFSVVRAREDVDTIVERRVTPPPRYGARVFTRDEITLDPAGWAEAVLADRAFPVLRWVPGDVRPLTAVSVERLLTIEAGELISIAAAEQDPPVFASGIVVGGDVTIVGRAQDEAEWRFRYNVAQTMTEPLIETGGAPTDYLLRTGGGEYVYPTTGA